MFKNTQYLNIPMEILSREDLTITERVVYGLLRRRLNLSVKNNLVDTNGHFVYYTQDEISNTLHVSLSTIKTAFKNLIKADLIFTIAQGKSQRIYFKPYEVADEFLIPEQEQQPEELPQEAPKAAPVHVDNTPKTGDKVGDNIGDNNSNGVEFTPIQNDENSNGVKITPIQGSNGVKFDPKKKELLNIKKNNKKNNKDLTLPNTPKVVIDYDLYTTYSKCFTRKPGVEIKNTINGFIGRGIEKDLVIEMMLLAGQNGWSFGYAVKELNKLAIEGIKTVDQYIDKQLIEEGIIAGPSEWEGVEQLIYI